MSDQAADSDAAVQQLFAHLRNRPQASPRSDSSANPFTMASPTPSRSISNSMQASASAADSFAAAGVAPPSSQSASLLNLLKFNTGTSSQNASGQSQNPSRSNLPLLSPASNQQHVRGVSTSDLVGSSMGRPTTHDKSNTPSPPTDSGAANLAGLTNPQEHLLKLLTRQQGNANESPARSPAAAPKQAPSPFAMNASTPPAAYPGIDTAAAATSSHSNRDSPIRVFGSRESREPTPFDPHDMPNNAKPSDKGIFTYSNPFEQLAANSPRNRTPAENGNGAVPQLPIHKHIAQSIEVASPAPLADGRTRVEALMGIGAPTTDAGIITEAVGNVAGQLDKQDLKHASAELPGHPSKKAKKEPSPAGDAPPKFAKKPENLPKEIKKEVDEDDQIRQALEKLTTDDAAIRDEIDAPADDEESSVNEENHQEVPVYNIPLKPFAAIQLVQPKSPLLTFREKSVTDIARLKKEFDQIDRSLVTASNDFIVYTTPKKPFGVRVISQDDGADRQLFKENDPIFNVSLSSSPTGKDPETEHETFIATGQSGTVYWAVIRRNGHDTIQDDDVAKHCLTFPPSPAQDDNTSGGQLKTRAKKSNRHPEFFAIGRGKTIQVIFPFHALSSKPVKKGVVDTDAYFKERSLKINTGKAGKDFTFSEDDSVLASLDKAGRLRFWDVRDIVDENNGTASKLAPIEVSAPILTVSTAHVNDKAWPTSVLFVDKVRPYVRGSALRYVIVGTKQNHTLQLWDLGLGKVVQELNLPHDNESDAICSVAYHPSTGIIVVGHPTRNSIYFIHLSAPKYNLQGISQAKYLHAIVSKNPSLPKTESTAIMSGIREYSFGTIRQIRSLDLLPSQGALSDKNVETDKGQFELYVMHSKGVTCLNIKKADLGWSADNKVITKFDGEQEGVVIVKELQELRPLVDSELSSVNGDAKAHSSRARSPLPDLAAPREKDHAPLADIAATNGTPSTISKSEKRKKKKAEAALEEMYDDIPPPAPAPPMAAYTPSRTPAAATQTPRKEPKTPKKEKEQPAADVAEPRSIQSAPESVSLSVSSDFIDREYRRIESGLKAAFDSALSAEMEKIRKRIDDDRRAADASGAAKQDAILRLVSTSLTENVDKTLDRIVAQNITKHVVPAVNNSTEKSLKKSVPEWLTKNLSENIASQLKQALPEAVAAAMGNQGLLQNLTEGVTSKIAKRIDREIHQNVIPEFQKTAIQAATQAASNVTKETERSVSEKLNRDYLKSRDDAVKIDKLTLLTEDLLETVRGMAENQTHLRSEIVALQEEVQRLRSQPAPAEVAQAQLEQPLEVSADPELDNIVSLMNEGRYEEGTIQWLQSSNQAALFDKFFVRFDPSYLQPLPSLITLSVGAAVIQSLDENLGERLNWLGAALGFIDPYDAEVSHVAPQIMDVVVSRLESRYMSLAEIDPTDQRLRQIPALTKAAKNIKTQAQSKA